MIEDIMFDNDFYALFIEQESDKRMPLPEPWRPGND